LPTYISDDCFNHGAGFSQKGASKKLAVRVLCREVHVRAVGGPLQILGVAIERAGELPHAAVPSTPTT